RALSGILAQKEKNETNETAAQIPDIDFGRAQKEMKALKKTEYLERLFDKKQRKEKQSVQDDANWLLKHIAIPKLLHLTVDLTQYFADLTLFVEPSSLYSLVTFVERHRNCWKKWKKKLTRWYLKHKHWHARASLQEDVEMICGAVISGAQHYASKKIPVARKQRALSTLLQHMKTVGVSLQPPGDITEHESHYLFQQPVLDHKLVMHVWDLKEVNDLFSILDSDTLLKLPKPKQKKSVSAYLQWLEQCSEKSQCYFYESIHRMCRIRMRRQEPHVDIRHEANRCYGVTENLLGYITRQRTGLSALLQQVNTLKQWHKNIQFELTTSLALLSSEQLNAWSGYNQNGASEITWKRCFGKSETMSTLESVYSKIIQICDEKNAKGAHKGQSESKPNKKKANTLTSQIFSAEEMAQFDSIIPDFVLEDSSEDKVETDFEAWIGTKTYLISQFRDALKRLLQFKSDLKLKCFTKLQSIIDQKIGQQHFDSVDIENYQPFYWLHTGSELRHVSTEIQKIIEQITQLPFYRHLNVDLLDLITESTVSEKANPENTSKSTEWKHEFTRLCDQTITKMLICVQDAIKVVQLPEFVTFYSSVQLCFFTKMTNLEANEESVKLQQQSMIMSMQAYNGKDISQAFKALTAFITSTIPIHQLAYNDRMLIDSSLKNLCLMLRYVIFLGQFVFFHNLQFCFSLNSLSIPSSFEHDPFEFDRTHKSFCKLEYVLTSLFNGLLVKGFCRPPDESEDNAANDANQQTELRDGVGMAEGEGIEDVSDEIKFESQIEGLQKQKPDPFKQFQKNEKKEEKEEKERKISHDDDTGIEMNDDFEGEMFDVEKPPEGEEADQKKKKKNKKMKKVKMNLGK
ncbi:type A von Willebrand factor domain-containing protein, partial [Reticulomyxa filosa]